MNSTEMSVDNTVMPLSEIGASEIVKPQKPPYGRPVFERLGGQATSGNGGTGADSWNSETTS